MGMAEVEQIGDFIVVGETLPRRRHDYDSACRIGANNVAHLAVLTGIGHGGAAEFQNF